MGRTKSSGLPCLPVSPIVPLLVSALVSVSASAVVMVLVPGLETEVKSKRPRP